MGLIDFMVRDVTVLNPSRTVDRYGNTVDGWTAPTSVFCRGWLAQQSTIEDHNGRAATITGQVLTVPAGTPIAASSRVLIDGVTFEVIGTPVAAWTPRGVHHIEARLEEVAG